nr:AAA family ATPase [uncultured Pseudomonas sp.]
MITRIVFPTNEINLRSVDSDDSVKPYNIFGVDSLSLLIGNNGAGKTHAFKDLIHEFRQGGIAKLSSRCVFKAEPKDGAIENYLEKDWGLIYFTPVPHGGRVHRSNKICDASPKANHPLDAFDLKDQTDLLKGFGVKTKLKAFLRVDRKKVICYLLDIASSITNDECGERLLGSEFKVFKALCADIKDRGSAFGIVAALSLRKGKSNGPVSKALHTCIAALDKRFFTDFDPVEVFSVFAVIEDQMSAKLQRPRLVADAIRFRFGIELMDGLGQGISPIIAREFLQKCDDLQEFIRKNHIKITKSPTFGFSFALGDSMDRAWLGGGFISRILNLGWEGLSSGEWALLSQMYLISRAVDGLVENGAKSVLILIDEGDAFLHLEWQRRYIGEIDKFLFKTKERLGLNTVQVIIATHSPLLASDVPSEYVCRLGEGPQEQVPSFAAPLQTLLNLSFSAKSIGQHAIETVNKTIGRIESRSMTDMDHYVVSIVDDPLIKGELKRLMQQNGYQ